MTDNRIITVFGGSGFVGRHIVRALLKTGARLRVAVRNPNNAYFLQAGAAPGQLQIVKADITNEETLSAALKGADAVVNLVGILHAAGGQGFDDVHAKGAEHVARLAKEAGITRFVHMSALGADRDAKSRYAATKGDGEAGVLEHFPNAAILRPSIVFGPEDSFFNRFAAMAVFSPVLPLIGGGKTKFQPVYVRDVAEAVVRILSDDALLGRVYELGGPEVLSFREVLDLICETIHRRRALLSIPFFFASVQALFLQMLPNPLLTMDQVRLLRNDNVVTGEEGLASLADLGITPTAAEVIIPTYLWIYRPHGQFDVKAA